MTNQALSADVNLSTMLGALYEHFVKAGCLRLLSERGTVKKHPAFDRLHQVKTSAIPNLLTSLGVTDEQERGRILRYVDAMSGWSSISGYGLLRDYLEWIGKGNTDKVSCVWLHCPIGSHHIGLGDLEDAAKGEVPNSFLKTFSVPDEIFQQWERSDPFRRGRFPNADWISVFKVGPKYHVLVLEFSHYASKESQALPDPENPAQAQQSLATTRSTLRQRGTYAHLNFDVSQTGFRISPAMSKYLAGVRRADKPAAKIMQGCAYAADFLHWLEKIPSVRKNGQVHVIAVTDRGTLSVSGDWTRHEAISEMARVFNDKISDETEDWEKFLAQHRGALFKQLIQSFEEPQRPPLRKFRDDVGRNDLENTDSISCVIREQVSNQTFRNPADEATVDDITSWFSTQEAARWLGSNPAAVLNARIEQLGGRKIRDAHAAAIVELLARVEAGKINQIFLTGHPGIGKTTAIRRWLSGMDEGFLFLYISPRIQISKDVIAQFGQPTTAQEILTLTTNHQTIKEAHRQRNAEREENKQLEKVFGAVVYGGTTSWQFPKVMEGIRYLMIEEDLTQEKGPAADETGGYVDQDRQTIKPGQGKLHGVLNCLSEGIAQAMKFGATRIVSAVSTQALKHIGQESTISALKKIVPHVKGVPDARQLKQLAAKIPNIVVMIDEITGSQEGVAFLHELDKNFHDWFIEPFEDAGTSPFKIQLVVADASLTDARVIERYLADARPEPDRIYVGPAGTTQPISLETGIYKKQEVPVINANAYPASSLHLQYRLDLFPYDPSQEDVIWDAKEAMQTWLNLQLINETLTALRDGKEQVIVYVQDVRRLKDIANGLKGKGLQEEDVLLIHSKIPGHRRDEMIREGLHYRARVVLMTSSASRGISFPKTSVIFVEVPRFNPEQAILEIIQLIYRGRGDIRSLDGKVLFEGDRLDRQIVFFLSDILPTKFHTLERFNDFLSMLVILRAAVFTRLTGSGRIQEKAFSVVPVGTKLVEDVAASDSAHLLDFYRELNKEFHNTASKPLRGVCQSGIDLLKRIVQEHGSYRATTKTNEVRPQRMDSEIFTDRYVLDRLAMRCRNGLDAIMRIEDFPKHAFYVPGLLIEEREGVLVDEQRFDLREKSVKDLKRLWGIATSLQSCKYESREEGTIHLPVESQLLKQSAAQIKEMIEKILRATKHEDGVVSDRRRVHELSGDGVWYAIPYLAFSLNGLYTKAMDEGSFEIKESWFGLISGIAKHCFKSLRNETPVIPDYTEIPFLLFRSGGVEMYRNSLFSPSCFNATHELNLLNLILLQDQQSDFEE